MGPTLHRERPIVCGNLVAAKTKTDDFVFDFDFIFDFDLDAPLCVCVVFCHLKTMCRWSLNGFLFRLLMPAPIKLYRFNAMDCCLRSTHTQAYTKTLCKILNVTFLFFTAIIIFCCCRSPLVFFCSHSLAFDESETNNSCLLVNK